MGIEYLESVPRTPTIELEKQAFLGNNHLDYFLFVWTLNFQFVARLVMIEIE